MVGRRKQFLFLVDALFVDTLRRNTTEITNSRRKFAKQKGVMASTKYRRQDTILSPDQQIFFSKTKNSPMKCGEQSSFRFLNKTFYSGLYAEPFKFACHQFVTRHHRIHIFHPFVSYQRSSSCFFRLESVRWGRGRRGNEKIV